jgi:hypothetical protein
MTVIKQDMIVSSTYVKLTVDSIEYKRGSNCIEDGLCSIYNNIFL